MRGVQRGFTLPPFPLRRPHARAPGSSPRAPFLCDERGLTRRSAHKPAHWNEPSAMSRPQCIGHHLLVPRPLLKSPGHLEAPLGAHLTSFSYCFRFVTRYCAHAQERSYSFALRYTCGDGFNENDLRLLTDALNERLARATPISRSLSSQTRATAGSTPRRWPAPLQRADVLGRTLEPGEDVIELDDGATLHGLLGEKRHVGREHAVLG